MSGELLSELDRDLRLLFYPSSGRRIGKVLKLPYELFIFADYEPRNSGSKADFIERMSGLIGGCNEINSTPNSFLFQKDSKIGLLFFEDNNEVLRYIEEDGRKIDCFVGRCDGCSEGGNYECVNDVPFFKKVVDLTSNDGMTYYTDHSILLSNTHPNLAPFDEKPRPEVIISGNLLSRVGIADWGQRDSQWGPIYEYKISHHHKTIREFYINGLGITLEHDSIADNLDGVEGVYVSTRCRRLFKTASTCKKPTYKGAPDYYFMPCLKSEWSTEESLRSLLELCEREKWKIVGTTAFGEGHHLNMMQFLENWQGTYPEWIRIFHFDHNDFSDVDDLFSRVSPSMLPYP